MKKNKKQVVSIGGGNVFKTYKEYLDFLENYKLDFKKMKTKEWKETLSEKLGEDFEVISPKMPNTWNAKYNEWKIIFQKLAPFLKNNVILLGHSLGGIFLSKYLSENKFPKKIRATFLISAPYDEKDAKYSLGDFKLKNNLDKFRKQGGEIFVYHSKDDSRVPFIDLEKYKKALPKAETVIFKEKGHFDQKEFPELIKAIKSLN